MAPSVHPPFDPHIALRGALLRSEARVHRTRLPPIATKPLMDLKEHEHSPLLEHAAASLHRIRKQIKTLRDEESRPVALLHDALNRMNTDLLPAGEVVLQRGEPQLKVTCDEPNLLEPEFAKVTMNRKAIRQHFRETGSSPQGCIVEEVPGRIMFLKAV